MPNDSVNSTFEAFPQEVINARKPASKKRELYVPPGGLPKVGDPYVSRPTAMNMDLTINSEPQPSNNAAHVNAKPQPVQEQARTVPASSLQSPNVGSLPADRPAIEPNSEDEAISVELPSRFAFYPFKDLYIRPFKVRQLAKISRSHKESSTLHLVEAVSSVLSTSDGTPNLGFKLTVNDFYWVLYWLRMNSYTKVQYTHTARCPNNKHYTMIGEANEKLSTMDVDSPDYSIYKARIDQLTAHLTVTQTITKSDLKTVMLNVDALNTRFPDVDNCFSNPDLMLSPITMHDTLETLQGMTVSDSEDDEDNVDEEFLYVANLASMIRLKSNPNATLAQRIEIVDNLDPDDVVTIQDYEALTASYGIEDRIKVTCKGCGAAWVSTITLAAHDFLPSNSNTGHTRS
jgi:hypothetical protein